MNSSNDNLKIAMLRPLLKARDIAYNGMVIKKAIVGCDADVVIVSELALPAPVLIHSPIHDPIHDPIKNSSAQAQSQKIVDKQLNEIKLLSKNKIIIVGATDTSSGLMRSTAYVYYQERLIARCEAASPTIQFNVLAKTFSIVLGEAVYSNTHIDAAAHCDYLIILQCAPFSLQQHFCLRRRIEMLSEKIKTTIYAVNTYSARDGLVYGGESYHVAAGDTQQLPSCGEEELVYNTIIFALQEQLKISCCEGVVIGISGGIDSALVASLAVAAFGAEKVKGIYLPSKYSSGLSERLALSLMENLSIEQQVIPVEELVKGFRDLNTKLFDHPRAEVDQNIQARTRAVVLMSFCNQYNSMLLATGNKSEAAMGYMTLYGDSCGGLGPIADLTKARVYQLSKWINREGEIIPLEIIERQPTAELYEGQLDSHSLPEYHQLDPIIESLLESNGCVGEVAERLDVARELVQEIWQRIVAAEFKRAQCPPAVRITETSFSFDWQCPVYPVYPV